MHEVFKRAKLKNGSSRSEHASNAPRTQAPRSQSHQCGLFSQVWRTKLDEMTSQMPNDVQRRLREEPLCWVLVSHEVTEVEIGIRRMAQRVIGMHSSSRLGAVGAACTPCSTTPFAQFPLSSAREIAHTTKQLRPDLDDQPRMLRYSRRRLSISKYRRYFRKVWVWGVFGKGWAASAAAARSNHVHDMRVPSRLLARMQEGRAMLSLGPRVGARRPHQS